MAEPKLSEMYGRAVDRMTTLVQGLDPAAHHAAVPSCPGWTLRDVVAHVVGLAADVVHGDVEGYAGADWTARQVERRAESSVDDLVSEWRAVLPAFSAINDDLSGSHLPPVVNTAIGPSPVEAFAVAFTVDLVQHELDVRSALNLPRSADEIDSAATRALVASARGVFAMSGLPSVELAATDTGHTWRIGRDEPVAAVHAPTLDLFRSLGGRRTLAQMAALDWSGDITDDMLAALVVPFFSAPVDAVE